MVGTVLRYEFIWKTVFVISYHLGHYHWDWCSERRSAGGDGRVSEEEGEDSLGDEEGVITALLDGRHGLTLPGKVHNPVS